MTAWPTACIRHLAMPPGASRRDRCATARCRVHAARCMLHVAGYMAYVLPLTPPFVLAHKAARHRCTAALCSDAIAHALAVAPLRHRVASLHGCVSLVHRPPPATCAQVVAAELSAGDAVRTARRVPVGLGRALTAALGLRHRASGHTCAKGLGSPRPNLHRDWDWAHPAHICTGTGLTPATTCAGTRRTPATSAPGRGSPLPTSARGLGSTRPHLRWD
jgi:hypothetical protein